jgi:hypothetical protein
MSTKCSNCGIKIITKEKHQIIVKLLEHYYGENWSNELNDISMELCETCGTLDGFLTFIEENLALESAKSYILVVKEFLDNQHIPFLLSMGAPVFIYLLEQGSISVKKAVVDALGTYGALDDIGRFVLSNYDINTRILGVRSLEKIEKHSKKRGLPFVWAEFIDIIIDNDLKNLRKLERSLPKLGIKPETRIIIRKILGKRKVKLEKKLKR